MADSPTPQNRASRRAAARKESKTSSDIPLAHPDRSGPKAKTLYDLAAERQAELEKSGFYKNEPKSTESTSQFISSEEDDEPIGPLGEALVYTISLAMVHFTLDVLVFHQYRQEVLWDEIFYKTLKMAPGLYFLICLLKCKTAQRYNNLRQAFFLVSSTVAGCYLVYSGNEGGYYEVMKKAPPVGVLWIWAVVEMELWGCVVNVGSVGLYMYWNGFSAF
jgi:hypothetical protein